MTPEGTISSLIASVRAKLNRRADSPAFVGGVPLGAVALGCLAVGRGKPRPRVYAESQGAWWRAVKTAQVLLPLLMALNSATSAARKPGADIGGTTR